MPGVKHGLDDADIFNRLMVGTNLTIFQSMVQFLEAKLRPATRQKWPPAVDPRDDGRGVPAGSVKGWLPLSRWRWPALPRWW